MLPKTTVLVVCPPDRRLLYSSVCAWGRAWRRGKSARGEALAHFGASAQVARRIPAEGAHHHPAPAALSPRVVWLDGLPQCRQRCARDGDEHRPRSFVATPSLTHPRRTVALLPAVCPLVATVQSELNWALNLATHSHALPLVRARVPSECERAGAMSARVREGAQRSAAQRKLGALARGAARRSSAHQTRRACAPHALLRGPPGVVVFERAPRARPHRSWRKTAPAPPSAAMRPLAADRLEENHATRRSVARGGGGGDQSLANPSARAHTKKKQGPAFLAGAPGLHTGAFLSSMWRRAV